MSLIAVPPAKLKAKAISQLGVNKPITKPVMPMITIVFSSLPKLKLSLSEFLKYPKIALRIPATTPINIASNIGLILSLKNENYLKLFIFSSSRLLLTMVLLLVEFPIKSSRGISFLVVVQ